MTLILWKAPVVDDPDAAKALLQPYYDHEDDSAFEASADVAKVADELLRRFPDEPDGPWSDFPSEQTDRLLVLDIRWSANQAVLDAIVDLAREHGLVLYDPQGPNVTLPTDPVDTGPVPAPSLFDYVKLVLMGAVGSGVFWLGRTIDVPVLDWILLIAGGFVVAVVLFLLGALMFGLKEETSR